MRVIRTPLRVAEQGFTLLEIMVVVVIIGFFVLCAAFVVGCGRIVRSSDDGSYAVSNEVTR